MWTSFLHREFGAAQGYASPNHFFFCKLPITTKFFVNYVFLAFTWIWQGSIIFLAANNFLIYYLPGSVVESWILGAAQYFPVSFLRIKGQLLLPFSSSSFAHRFQIIELCRLLFILMPPLFQIFFLLAKKTQRKKLTFSSRPAHIWSWWLTSGLTNPRAKQSTQPTF